MGRIAELEIKDYLARFDAANCNGDTDEVVEFFDGSSRVFAGQTRCHNRHDLRTHYDKIGLFPQESHIQDVVGEYNDHTDLIIRSARMRHAGASIRFGEGPLTLDRIGDTLKPRISSITWVTPLSFKLHRLCSVRIEFKANKVSGIPESAPKHKDESEQQLHARIEREKLSPAVEEDNTSLGDLIDSLAKAGVFVNDVAVIRYLQNEAAKAFGRRVVFECSRLQKGSEDKIAAAEKTFTELAASLWCAKLYPIIDDQQNVRLEIVCNQRDQAKRLPRSQVVIEDNELLNISEAA